ncbi:hypothetical protein AAHC03_016566 [Spirometra sp. Aus1]
MNWQRIVGRTERILSATGPRTNFPDLEKPDISRLINRVRKIAAKTKHPFVGVLGTHLRESHLKDQAPYLSFFLAQKSSLDRPVESLMIPLVGKYTFRLFPQSSSDLSSKMNEHRRVGEICDLINIALSLHRSVVEVPASQETDQDQTDEYARDMEDGNKLATLSGDILLASASLSLAAFQNPAVVEIMSAAIADAVAADFSDFIQFMEDGTTLSTPVSEPNSSSDNILAKWHGHIALRHGVMLGTSCGATVLLSSHSEQTDVATSVLPTFRRFGVAWASFCRLTDELAFLKKCLHDNGFKAAAVRTPALPFPCLGFTAYGLFEPMLADACRLLGGSSQLETVAALYARAVERLRGDLLAALSSLFQLSVRRGGQQEEEEMDILSDAVALLLSDAASLQDDLSIAVAKQPS